MSYNSITSKTVHILAEGLSLSTSIRSLVMDGNMLTRSGATDIHDALQRESGDTIHLSIQDCGVNGKLSHEFDPSEPGGEYTLNLASEYDMKILFNLVKIAMEGRGDFQRGSMQVDGKSALHARIGRALRHALICHTVGRWTARAPSSRRRSCKSTLRPGSPRPPTLPPPPAPAPCSPRRAA